MATGGGTSHAKVLSLLERGAGAAPGFQNCLLRVACGWFQCFPEMGLQVVFVCWSPTCWHHNVLLLGAWGFAIERAVDLQLVLEFPGTIGLSLFLSQICWQLLGASIFMLWSGRLRIRRLWSWRLPSRWNSLNSSGHPGVGGLQCFQVPARRCR